LLIKKLIRHNFFVLGALLCGVFTLLGFLGFAITTDTSPDANTIMPEWSMLPPGTQKEGIELKRKSIKGGLFWLYGDEGKGELFSVLGNFVVKGDSVSFIHEKTHMRITLALSEIEVPKIKRITFYLGTDAFGRDILSRLIIGARISLSIGFLSMFLSMLIGITIGLISGYFGGVIDRVLSWIITVFWSVPTLLLALGLSVVFGKGYYQVLIATGLSTWVEVARLVRGQTLQIKNQEFVLFAKISGFSHVRVMVKHILPNMTASLTVIATTNFASAILLEAGLGFLGLGVAPPTPSWGIMVKEHLGFLVLEQSYLAIIPGLAIMILVMAFNFMSMGIRDVLD